MALAVPGTKADPDGPRGAARGAGVPIVAAGARGPLGLTALEVAMCARAQKLDVWPTRFEDRWRFRIGASRARYLPDDLHGFDRLVALGAPALREAAGAIAGPVPLYLAIAEPGRPDDDPRMGPELIAALARASGVAIDVERSVVVRSGHAGGGMALELAMLRMRDAGLADRPSVVVVGGLDSYYHGDVLRWLDEERRLHSQGAVDGFFPGEGAAFVVVAASAEEAQKAGPALAAPIATIAAAASGREETIGTEEPNIAVAMTRAVRSAAEGARGAPIAWVLSDVNGERHRVDEWSKVTIRSRDLFVEDVRHDRLPAMMGDLGAASGPMALAIAATWLRTGAAPAPRALVALHADGQDRAVTVIDAAPEAPAPAATPPRRREAPAKATAPVLAEAIERVVRSVPRLPPSVDRAGLEALLAAALHALSQWERTDLLADDHLARLADAAARVRVAREELGALAADEAGAQGLRALRHVEASLAACREVTIGEIVAEQDAALRGGRVEEPAAREAAPFRASAGAPLVHASERDPLLPLGDAPRDARTPEEAALRGIARDALEDVAILGGLRQPNDDEPWSRTDVFETRLLANLDALASLDRAVSGPDLGIDVPQRALAYGQEAAWADAGRAFARAFVLSCFGAEEAVRAAVEGLRRSHPITHAAQRDALCLAASPRVVPAMERLLWDDDPALVRLAAEVLRFRRAATLPAMLPLLSHPDVGVLSAAARAMGTVEPREAAIAALGGLLGEGVEDRVAVAALESLALLGDPAVLERVSARLAEEEARPGTLSTAGRLGLLRIVAAAGGAEHAGLLVRALARTPAAVTAVGWYGHAAHVEPVLEVLALANEQRSGAAISPTQLEIDAARALLRITGIYLEDPDEPSGIGLAMRASLWRAHFADNPLDLRPDVRWRMGLPYRPAASLAELSDEGTAAHARRWAALELGVLAGRGWAFEPGDWVARQKEQLAAMQARVEGGIGYEAGEWPDAYLRRRRAHEGR